MDRIHLRRSQSLGSRQMVSLSYSVSDAHDSNLKQHFEEPEPDSESQAFSKYDLVTEQHLSMLYSEERENGKRKMPECSQKNIAEAFKKLFPFVRWIPQYDWRNYFCTDLSTGITIGIILIPQGLSYGLLAGLPAEFGLYACLAACCVYALFGTCNQIHIGPFALISLLVVDTVGAVVPPYEPGSTQDPSDYIDAVMTTSFFVGLILTVLGLLNLGNIVSYLSDPVISSLTTAGAFLIATSQMKHFLGLDIERGSFLPTWINIFSNITDINVATLLVGVISLASLRLIDWLGRKVKRKIPGALIVLVLSIVIVYLAGLDERFGVMTLKEVPEGLPVPRFPSAFRTDLLVPSLIIAIIGFALSISTGKTLAEKNGYEIDPSQEMFAHGMANCIGSIFLGYPAFASLSRSAICHSMGVQSPVHNFIATFVVIMVLLFLTSLLYTLPFATLAAIIFHSLRSVFWQITDVKPLWDTNKRDFTVWIITFLVTIFFGIEFGLIAGVASSIAFLMLSVSYPPTSVLGQLPDLPWVFKNVARYPQAKSISHVLIFRFGASLHFVNKDCLNRELFKALAEQTGCEQIHSVVFDASSLNYADVSGIKTLKKIQAKLACNDIELVLCNCRGAFRDALRQSGFTALRYTSIYDAVKYAGGKLIVGHRPQSSDNLRESDEELAPEEFHGGKNEVEALAIT